MGAFTGFGLASTLILKMDHGNVICEGREGRGYPGWYIWELHGLMRMIYENNYRFEDMREAIEWYNRHHMIDDQIRIQREEQHGPSETGTTGTSF